MSESRWRQYDIAFRAPAESAGFEPATYSFEAIGVGLGSWQEAARFLREATRPSTMTTKQWPVPERQAARRLHRLAAAGLGQHYIALTGRGFARSADVGLLGNRPVSVSRISAIDDSAAALCRRYGA
ncbi:hypothetical protein [Nocardia camponoti]|uniref:hypothetical protein n=1 Tax=Nocardia camponoti TaxID=1616106 RepID=UPI00166465C7|nr:hypothetical protein [Nocardia camponoti]